MGWAVGFDSRWDRDIGYGVPASCDHPGCGALIDRGLANVCCGQEPYGGDRGCGLFFCGDHHHGMNGRCERCSTGRGRGEPFDPTPDVPDWMRWKLRHPSWLRWRHENPADVECLRRLLRLAPKPPQSAQGVFDREG